MSEQVIETGGREHHEESTVSHSLSFFPPFFWIVSGFLSCHTVPLRFSVFPFEIRFYFILTHSPSRFNTLSQYLSF